VFLLLDEVQFDGDDNDAAKLRGLITERFIDVNSKGTDSKLVKNHLSLLALSNFQNCVPSGSEHCRGIGRRYALFDANPTFSGLSRNTLDKSGNYFARVVQEVESGTSLFFVVFFSNLFFLRRVRAVP
jgi:hypothetical protein